MVIYVEENIREHGHARSIIEKFPRAQIIEISNYKNIFDASHGYAKKQSSMIIARAPNNPVLPAPHGYGFEWAGYFFKTSLGCIYDCEYCYLKGMFKNDIPVYFVDYEFIQSQISKAIETERKDGNSDTIWFYSSDYSDIQGMDVFSGFNESFIPFFEQFENVMMESRTKSSSIQSLLHVTSNTLHVGWEGTCNVLPATCYHAEIAYSLNPQPIIDHYEKWTAPLKKRLENINTLLEAGWKVGIRIMPLMPIQNYEQIYIEFIETLKSSVDIRRLHSVFIGWLMFTKKDYRTMRKKWLLADMIDKVDDEGQDFVRLNQAYRLSFYQLFRKHFPRECEVCLDKQIQI